MHFLNFFAFFWLLKLKFCTLAKKNLVCMYLSFKMKVVWRFYVRIFLYLSVKIFRNILKNYVFLYFICVFEAFQVNFRNFDQHFLVCILSYNLRLIKIRSRESNQSNQSIQMHFNTSLLIFRKYFFETPNYY
jgi:hypothetical protein